MVPYEQLVLHPRDWLDRILLHLEVPWDDVVLHHEQLINLPGGISLSKVERSSDQVVKPINLEALTKWIGNIPEDVMNDMAEIAPMMIKLGYDPDNHKPDYGKADTLVVNNTLLVAKNEDHWANKTKYLLRGKQEHQTD